MAPELIVGGLLVPVEKDGPGEYLKAAALRLKVPDAGLETVRILSKVPVFTDPEQFYYEVSLAVRAPAGYENKDNFPPYAAAQAVRRKKRDGGRPVIIGFGPAGMFAALELIEYGLRPLVFERGKPLEERHLDVQRFINSRALDAGSNIQFGEGGAGAYSDGKLFSRPNNTVHAGRVLDTFIKFGAPPGIAYASKPHLGTDVLRRIVLNIRNYILAAGGEIRYSSKMTGLRVAGGKAAGVEINGEADYPAAGVYLAIGNSARDTFRLLHETGVSLEAKPVSVGVRVEHPAETINLLRYGAKYRDFPGLGAATYSFNYTNRKTRRGAYTFCMCPGGEVVNASSEEGLLALNGMSYAARNSAFSNSAIAVTCTPADYGSSHPLAGFEFQAGIERKAFLAGGGDWRAPAQNLVDFLAGMPSGKLNDNSYKMGVRAADLGAVFPAFVTDTLRAAFREWAPAYPLFCGDNALLLGPETRTSSPVRILRGANYEAVNIGGLYPIGEGSGYSGGITSAAVDAIKAVEAAMRY